MQRSLETEYLDRTDLPEATVLRCYRQLTRIQALLGNTRAIVAALRRDPLPVRRVLDIGCASGGVLLAVRRKLAVEVLGIDLKPAPAPEIPVPILCADATRDLLPAADVAYCTCLAHHLPPGDLEDMIRNVRRSCRRFILLDLVRHRLPMALFRMSATPFFNPFVVEDGLISIRRSYTPAEMRAVVSRALDGSGARFHHRVAPFGIRQVVDIDYRGGTS